MKSMEKAVEKAVGSGLEDLKMVGKFKSTKPDPTFRLAGVMADLDLCSQFFQDFVPFGGCGFLLIAGFVVVRLKCSIDWRLSFPVQAALRFLSQSRLRPKC